MKKILLTLGLLSGTLSLLQAQEIIYALPQTTLVIHIEVCQEHFYAGPYAAYAKNLLNMDVRQNDAVTSTLVQAVLDPRIEADPAAWYTCDTENALLKLSAQGLIAFRDTAEIQPRQWRFANPAHKDYTRRGLTGPDKEVTQIEYKKVQTDTAEIIVPVEHKMLEKKSLEDKATEAADMILSLREERRNIVTGNTDANYAGEAMATAIQELDRMEKEYLSLFCGYTVRRNFTASFDVTPSPAERVQRYVAFRLTDDGAVREGPKGKPYYLELEPENSSVESLAGKKLKANAIHYRIPVICQVRLTADGHTLLETRLPIYQLGEEAVLYPSK